MPVNADGTGWRESHAFGDFCYICHAGNQRATDINEAHAAMVPPLSDVSASCQMCHAADLTERAQVYAIILNVSLEGGSGDSGSAAPTSEPAADDFWGSEPATTNMPPEITWSVILLVGLFFGGTIGAATSGTLKWGKKCCQQ